MVRRVDGIVGVEDRVTYEQDDREVLPAPPPEPLAGGRTGCGGSNPACGWVRQIAQCMPAPS
jgi:hypothetical protein